jgi:hypothetical protein
LTRKQGKFYFIIEQNYCTVWLLEHFFQVFDPSLIARVGRNPIRAFSPLDSSIIRFQKSIAASGTRSVLCYENLADIISFVQSIEQIKCQVAGLTEFGAYCAE